LKPKKYLTQGKSCRFVSLFP